MSEPTTEPLSAEEEARVRRGVREMLLAEWGDEPATAYHPEEMCQSERDLIRLLATLDRDRAVLAALREEVEKALPDPAFTITTLGGWTRTPITPADGADSMRDRVLSIIDKHMEPKP